MNFRNFSLTLLFSGVALLVQAAPPVFDVNAPKWSKLAECETEGVNIRKAPSATAPRLVYDESKILEYDVPVEYYAYWSSAAPRGSVSAISYYGVHPIVSESSGWYEILNIGPKLETNGWVNAKYINVVSPTPMKFPGKPVVPNFTWLNTPGDTSDGVYGIYLDFDEMSNSAEFYVGRLVDGYLVCPYSFYCAEMTLNEGSNKCNIQKVQEYYVFNYAPGVLTEDYNIDMSKIGSDVLHFIVDKATKDSEKVICEYNGYLYVVR